MAEVRVGSPAQEVGRLGAVAAWISAAACLPYLFLKVVWTLDIPVGLTDRSVLDSSGWVAGNAAMALVQLVAVGLVLALVRPWSPPRADLDPALPGLDGDRTVVPDRGRLTLLGAVLGRLAGLRH